MNPPDKNTPAHQAIELREAALCWLAETDAVRKAAGVRLLALNWLSGEVELDADTSLTPQQPIPGQPARPELVPPLSVKKRAMHTPEGRAVLIHALAHIEFNAINLALDAIWRFAGMPRAYYADWLQVAGEEALHFTLLAEHLQGLGYVYGDFPAHNSLWEMAAKTQHDILARIARNGVTAVLNFSEDSSLEAIHILTNILGLSIPGDLSVITMEDLPVFQYLTPPHTVIRQPLAELVRVGVEKMIELCNGQGKSPDELIDITLPSELIERDSVRQIDSHAER